MSKFLHDADNDTAKAIAIPWIFSENSHGKKKHTIVMFSLSVSDIGKETTQNPSITTQYCIFTHLKIYSCRKHCEKRRNCL